MERARTLTRSFADIPSFGYDGTARPRSGALVLPPSVYVVGAPRCGSTSLSRALASNPQISFSWPKETHFLMHARGNRSLKEWRRDYLERYQSGLREDHRLVADGSVSYIFSGEAILRALEFDDRARFVALVRNPVKMIPSFHRRLCYLLDEDQHDLATAWSLQEQRARGERIPRHCRDPRVLQYGSIGKFSVHIERLFDIAGRDRCLVLLFDDLLRAPRESYLRVLNFIGADDDGRKEIPRKRESVSYRWRPVQRLVMNPPDWVLRWMSHHGRNVSTLRLLRKRLKRLNERPVTTNSPTPTIREALRQYFSEDVGRLSLLIGRDLSHWTDSETG